MSDQFEAEIRNSIQLLSGAVARLSTETERANAGMRKLGTETRVAAAAAADVGKVGVGSMDTVARAAQKTGGHMSKAFGLAAGALSGLNPIALAAGAGVGFITSKVFELIGALGQANEEAARLDGVVSGGARSRKEADKKAVLGADVGKMRSAAIGEIGGLSEGQSLEVNKVLARGGSMDEALSAASASAPANGMFGASGLSQAARSSIIEKFNDPSAMYGLQQANQIGKVQSDAAGVTSAFKAREVRRGMGDRSADLAPTAEEFGSSNADVAKELRDSSDRMAKAAEVLAKAMGGASGPSGTFSIAGSRIPAWAQGSVFGGTSSGADVIEAQRDLDTARLHDVQLRSAIERSAAQDY